MCQCYLHTLRRSSIASGVLTVLWSGLIIAASAFGLTSNLSQRDDDHDDDYDDDDDDVQLRWKVDLPNTFHLANSSLQEYQNVFLSTALVVFSLWLLAGIILLVGTIKKISVMFVPWLFLSGLLAPMCIFGIFHLLLSSSYVDVISLVEFIALGISFLLPIVLTYPVFAYYRNRLEESGEDSEMLIGHSCCPKRSI